MNAFPGSERLPEIRRGKFWKTILTASKFFVKFVLVNDSFRKDVERLISLYEQQKARGDSLASEVSDLQAKLTQYKQQNTDLTKEVNRLKLASALADGTDRTASKEGIDKLIREIDKCIKLIG